MSYIIKEAVPLRQLTTFQQEGLAPRFIECTGIDQLKEVINEYPDALVIGKGSNSLINPDKLTMPIIRLHAKENMPTREGACVRMGAGVTVNQFLQFCISEGLSGFEFMAGVPASVGGMIAMNFGCWEKEISHTVKEVTLLTRSGELKTVEAQAMRFGYRSSRIQTENEIVVSVVLSGTRSNSESIKQEIDDNIEKRIQSQPLRGKTFGSTFKNPEGAFAGRCLEQAGFKNKHYKNVTFSEKHANFMLNLGGATFTMATDLIDQAILKVKEEQGIHLEKEVRLLP